MDPRLTTRAWETTLTNRMPTHDPLSGPGDRGMTAPAPSRRRMLRTFANGFGVLGLAQLLASEGRAAETAGPPAPHFTPRAKRVIFLFMSGGPSHVDLFDPKPRLFDYAGKPLPFEQPKLVRT